MGGVQIQSVVRHRGSDTLLGWLIAFLLASLELGQPTSGTGTVVVADAPQAHASQSPKKPNAVKQAGPSATDGKANSDAPAPRSTAAEAPKKRKPAKLDDAPRIKTADEMRSEGSPFLRPADAQAKTDSRSRVDSPDLTDLPPWRQSSFFGLRSSGQFFVYVIDCSESMIDDDRFARATIELRRSVLALQPPQKFEVIFYNKSSIPMPGGPVPRTADQTEKSHLMSWLRIIEPIGTTDPRQALRQALALRPDAVYLLSDGEYPDGTVDDVIKLNTRSIPIHCIDLSGGLGGNHLARIARSSGGRYASRPVNTLRGSP